MTSGGGFNSIVVVRPTNTLRRYQLQSELKHRLLRCVQEGRFDQVVLTKLEKIAWMGLCQKRRLALRR